MGTQYSINEKINLGLSVVNIGTQIECIEEGEDLSKIIQLGWQYSKGISFEIASNKELDISKFKHGFGGFTVPLFRGEKYYSYEYFEKNMKERIQKLKEWLG